jgi:outer membrane lipoprotein-sorting protein
MIRRNTIFLLSIFAFATCSSLRADNHPTDAPLPPNAPIDTILEALNERVAKLSDTTGDSALGNDKTRTGTIWFSRQSPTQLRVHVLFDKLVVGHIIENEKIEYLLDGDWLTDRTYAAKNETKRQVLKPGEKKDLMKLGSGAFPLPIGQDKEDVKKAFDVAKVAPNKDDPADTIHLTLMPKEGTDMAKKFTSIDVWVDLKSHMPTVIDTVSGSEEHRIELKDIHVNPTPPLSDKDFTLPEIDSSWQSKTEKYEG